MEAEIQFFMTSKDEKDFLIYAEQHVDSIDHSHSAIVFKVGDCNLNFYPSVKDGNQLFLGRLEVRLGMSQFKDQERAKSVFRKLRNWLKKGYFSRLAFLNKRSQLTPSRVHWLGPDAKKWKLDKPKEHLLRLSTTSNTVFDIGF